MEDLLILILQGLAQIAFEIFAYFPWDWIWYFSPFDREEGKTWQAGGAVVTSLVMGALVGWVSLHFFPDVLIHWGWLRVALLVLSPLASGFASREMARWRQETNVSVDPALHFWIGLCFSVGLVWVRFAFAHRTG